MQRGVEILTDVFLRAGAKRVMPMVVGCDEITDQDGLAKLRRMRLGGGDFDVSAFHPLGTCRMGTDPARSCVGPDGEAHDVAGLFVADGSTLPSSLGANPQMTIMAFGLRTAEAIDARLDSMSAARPARRASRRRAQPDARLPRDDERHRRRPRHGAARERVRSRSRCTLARAASGTSSARARSTSPASSSPRASARAVRSPARSGSTSS